MRDIQVSTDYGHGVATTNHAASSYGLPVVVVDGTVYGPAELLYVGIGSHGPDDADEIAMHQSLLSAGYKAYA